MLHVRYLCLRHCANKTGCHKAPGYRGWLPGGSAGFLVVAGGANKPVSWCFGPVSGRFGVAQGHFLEGALRAKSPWIDRFCRKNFEGWGCRPRPSSYNIFLTHFFVDGGAVTGPADYAILPVKVS